MKERPILMSAPMVRTLLEGRKTQTRRVVKWNNRSGVNLKFSGLTLDHSAPNRWELLSRDGDMRWHERAYAKCPYGKPSDRLWVREAWATCTSYDSYKPSKLSPAVGPLWYAAGGGFEFEFEEKGRTRSSMFMPRWASRITLEITEVRVQRLQDISEEDAAAEGVTGPWRSSEWKYPMPLVSRPIPVANYASLWQEINGAGSWDANPFVWAVSFKVCP